MPPRPVPRDGSRRARAPTILHSLRKVMSWISSSQEETLASSSSTRHDTFENYVVRSNSQNSTNFGPPPAKFGNFTGPPPKAGFCMSCVHDNDPRLRYSGAWNLNGNTFATTHSTTTSFSTVSFTFNGTGIVVFGTVPPSNETIRPPTAVYIMDDMAPFATTIPTARKAIANQPLFAASQLSPDVEHTFLINVTQAESPYTLDYFFIFKSNDSQEMVEQLPTGTDSSPTQSTSASSWEMQETPNASGSPVSSVHKSVKILAGILGTVVALAIFVGVFFVIRRQRRRRREAEEMTTNAKLANRETMLTSFTSTESILRNSPPSMIWSTNRYSRSDFRSDGRASTVDFFSSPISITPVPPPLPPKPDSGALSRLK
ncbi:hypothetical protein BDQ12DRAFT_723530 [Crucibulum laeve]|uniref:Uncharacterized protein n=1 Tax=Crucibulum laeve TaxID=68775 RepID=A0A5C3M0F0_9AGAR|nr:hypothetical protein BDQ12DRAFT_723530 [Crucibulum laeve]